MTQDRTKILETAQKYAAKGLHDRAITEFKKVLESNPRDIRTLLKVGDLYTRKNERDKAIEHYNRGAEQYAQQGFFLKAAAVYKQILKLSPRRLDAAMRLAEMYKQLALVTEALNTYEDIATQHFEDGNHPQGLAILALMVNLDPTNVPVRIKYAEALSQAGSTIAAAEQFEAGAQLLKEQNRTDDYIKVCERLLFHRSDDLALAHEIASLYLKKKEPKAALAKLQVCFNKDPHEPHTLELLAQAFQQVDQTDKAVSVYRELARVYQQQNRLQERAEVFRKILTINPSDEEAKQALAGRASIAGFPSSAPITSHQLPELEGIPSSEVVYLQDEDSYDLDRDVFSNASGNTHVPEEETDTTTHDGLLAQIRKTLEASSPPLSTVFDEPHEHAESSSDADHLRPMTPSEFDALPVEGSLALPLSTGRLANTRVEEALDEAEFYLVQGLYDETRLALEELSKHHPHNPLVISKLEEANELVTSLDDSSPLLTVDTDQSSVPPDADSLTENILEEPESSVQTSEFSAGLRRFRPDIKEQLSKEDTETHFDLGIAYKEMGLFDDAIEEFKICMNNASRECNASTMIGICYKEKGQLTEAIKNFKRGLHAEQKTKEEELGLFYELGLAYEALGDTGEALYYFHEVAKRNSSFRHAQQKINDLQGKSLL